MIEIHKKFLSNNRSDPNYLNHLSRPYVLRRQHILIHNFPAENIPNHVLEGPKQFHLMLEGG